ncbi:hypothetical protein BCV72DRAFT_320102 [Rhizopus microsporus var. microsporus]|uniref:Uncharacterized protein n=1 Tax=Rhizopus microsporus var. microsporus TaxID=86635 RepID=A0A1X0QQ13_RHIZD|nr:hypothetical protein BCV72DRAFT_320102 [Rhizopus microsporus var. microsporus]
MGLAVHSIAHLHQYRNWVKKLYSVRFHQNFNLVTNEDAGFMEITTRFSLYLTCLLLTGFLSI